MKSGFLVRAAALVAAAWLGALPAMAQVTRLDQLTAEQEDEIYCLHDELLSGSEPFYLVAEAFLYGVEPDEAEGALGEALDICAKDYKWDADKRFLAEEAGLRSVVVSYLVEELYAGGAKDADILAIDRVATRLSNDDLKRFLDESWLEDDKFIERINGLLVAEKFPADDRYNLETARLILESHIGQVLAAMEWVQLYINKQ